MYYHFNKEYYFLIRWCSSAISQHCLTTLTATAHGVDVLPGATAHGEVGDNFHDNLTLSTHVLLAQDPGAISHALDPSTAWVLAALVINPNGVW